MGYIVRWMIQTAVVSVDQPRLMYGVGFVCMSRSGIEMCGYGRRRRASEGAQAAKPLGLWINANAAGMNGREQVSSLESIPLTMHAGRRAGANDRHIDSLWFARTPHFSHLTPPYNFHAAVPPRPHPLPRIDLIQLIRFTARGLSRFQLVV